MANISLEADFTFKQSVANKLKTDGLGNPYLSPLNEKIFIKEAYDHSAIWMDTVGVTLGKNGGGTIAYQEFHALYDVNRIPGVSDTPAYYGWTWRTSVFDWITPEYHTDYEIQVFHAPAGTTYASTLDHVDNTATPYVIDYITGALTFIASVPSYLTSGGHILYMQGYTYTGRKGLASVAHTGSYLSLIDKPNIVIDYNNLLNKPSLCNVAFTGLATDITFPGENGASLILHKTIQWLLPSVDAVQANWNTADISASSYVKNKPPITHVSDTTITGNMACTSNIVCSSNVTASQFFGSGDVLTGLPSIWKTNGTSVFIPAGSNVGNIASPTVALDISGNFYSSSGLSARSLNTGNVDTKTFFITGTLPSSYNTAKTYALPAGCIESNIISICGLASGYVYCSVGNNLRTGGFYWDAWVNGSLYVWVSPTPYGTNAKGKTFNVIITTT